ncbi:methyltransferase [Candidatus Pacearchaeota archaeon]|nr:methyltransferase [Candidatus Pacearchaeota archaeon]
MIYKPVEDSYLLTEVLKKELPELIIKNNNLKFLEIGAGSGIHLFTAEKIGVKKQNIFSSDIDKDSVNHCNLLGYNCIKSNLFENINDKYDLIIFNPPYLPEDSKEPSNSKIATTGGKKGDEIILSFLEQVKDYLNKNGKVFLLTSNLTPKIDFKKLGYKVKELGCEKLFYEQLCVWELVI